MTMSAYHSRDPACDFGTYEDVVHLIFSDFGGKVDMYFYALLRILGLDRLQQTVKPFGRTKVPNDPDKVDLAQASLFPSSKVVHAVPDGLEDRGEGCHSNTGWSQDRPVSKLTKVSGHYPISLTSYQQDGLKLVEIL
jgi:hypothetical protein